MGKTQENRAGHYDKKSEQARLGFSGFARSPKSIGERPAEKFRHGLEMALCFRFQIDARASGVDLPTGWKCYHASSVSFSATCNRALILSCSVLLHRLHSPGGFRFLP